MIEIDMPGQSCPIPAIGGSNAPGDPKALDERGAGGLIVKTSVTDLLDLSGRSVVAVTGCGGKTSLVELIAGKCLDKKVLVSPTTKIFPMRKEGVTLCGTLPQCREHRPHPGVQCLGLMDEGSGKLTALPEDILAGMVPDYDIALLEADGSGGLPCKGWLEHEPVVPDYCTHTVGVVTMAALGMAATESTVHRLPEFLSLTGLREGDAVTMEALEAMACAPEGMFRKSAGRRYLVVNQVEDDAAVRAARVFLRGVREKYPDRFAGLIYGSVHMDVWREV